MPGNVDRLRRRRGRLRERRYLNTQKNRDRGQRRKYFARLDLIRPPIGGSDCVQGRRVASTYGELPSGLRSTVELSR